MKMTLGVIVGVILGALILFAGSTLLVKYALSQISRAASNQTTQPVTSPLFDYSSPTPSLSPAIQPTINVPSTPESTPEITSSGSEAVNFDLAIISVSGSGLSRTINGKISNTGNQDAHNVMGKIGVISSNKQIKINGQDYFINKDFGAIPAGQSITAQVDLTFGLLDSLSIAQNGATVTLEITSDEENPDDNLRL